MAPKIAVRTPPAGFPPAKQPPAAIPAKQAPAPLNPLQIIHRGLRVRASVNPATLAAALDFLGPDSVEDILGSVDPATQRRDDIVDCLLARIDGEPLPADWTAPVLNALRDAIAQAAPDSNPKAHACIRPFHQTVLAGSLVGSILPSILDECPFAPDSKLIPSWEEATLLCCPGGQESAFSRRLRTVRDPANEDPCVLQCCRLLLAELLAPSLAMALDACRPPGSTNRTAVATARAALHHGFCVALADYQ